MGTLAGSFLAARTAANAQQSVRVRRIGVLTAGPAGALPAPFFDALRELGWIEGRNIAIDRRTGDGKPERVPVLATELVRQQVEVIVTFGAVAGIAAKNATKTIPIVATTGDPVAFGLVSNMSRPGGNITGIALVAPELSAKRLELLRELLPSAIRIGELVDPANPYWQAVRKDHERNFRSRGMQPIFVEVADASEIDAAIAEIARRRADALNVRGDPLFEGSRERIARLAIERGLPTMAEGRPFAAAGALISYGPVIAPLAARAATLVDRILKGANPGDLPIEQPSKFELVVNMKTAKALGVKILPSILGRTDQVIE